MVLPISKIFPKAKFRMNKINESMHFKNGKFRNQTSWISTPLGKNLGTLWKFLFGGEQRTPGKRLPVHPVELHHFANPGNNGLKAAWLGHSSLLIHIDGYKILTDPVFQKKVSFLGPSRFNGDVPLDINLLPEIDVVIVSHNHYDHLNKFSIQRLKEKTKSFIVPLAVGAQLEQWGVDRQKIIELDWWQEYPVTNDLKIAATPAQHFSGRGFSDRDVTLWASWVIQAPVHTIFFSGDSGYFKGFKEIGDNYGPFDMTFLECGAYHEEWHDIHMYPEETLQAHLDLKGEILLPIHWSTLNLSLHPWYEPIKRLSAAAGNAHVKLATPMVGETTVYGSYIPSQKWWEPLIL
ncbi:MAG: hypothetical protein QG657_3837 [Acidobacteriota bacterium]|nr:hypothetical protein [Acidobacteriota bacterium]